jgi:tricarballylate dehydrogenase
MADLKRKFDVLVIGGNAAVRRDQRASDASVLVLEARRNSTAAATPPHRNMRCAHDAATGHPHRALHRRNSGMICCMTGGQTDEELAKFMIRGQGHPELDRRTGRAPQPSLGGTLSLGRTNSFFSAAAGRAERALSHRRKTRRGDHL